MELTTEAQRQRAQRQAAERYVLAAQAAGCPREQIANFLRAGVVLQPKQLEASSKARLCDVPLGPTKIGFGGARGGGKSHWMLSQMGADDCIRYPGLKCLLLRKVGKALKEGFADLLPKVLPNVSCKYVPSRSLLVFENGSQIVLGHFQKESDIDAYLGLEYDIIGTEEATTLSASKRKSISTCCRTSKPGWRPREYDTTNPGGVSHAQYKALYIVPFKAGKESTTRFVPSTVDDNAFVNAEYTQVLSTLTGWQLRAWRYGDWDIAAGQFFTTFRADIHVRETRLGKDWPAWGSLDYGFTHYTTAYLMGLDADGVLHIADEHAERKKLPQWHAPGILAMLERNGRTPGSLRDFVASPDAFSQRGTGATIAETYEDNGLRLWPANNDRINGAGEFLARLGDVDAVDKNGEPAPTAPRLVIDPRCARLIECLPNLEHDPHRPEDVLKVDADDEGLGGDDSYDSARYGVIEAPVRRQSWFVV